jgi:hypothetical protein
MTEELSLKPSESTTTNAEPARTETTTGALNASHIEDYPESEQRWVLALILGALGSFTLLLHSPAYVLTTPFWLDEAWVAVASKAPFDRLPTLTSSTPLGWTLTMLAIPGSGEQRYRLLPLAFAAGSVVVAFLLARDLGWPSRTYAYVAGTTAALAAAVVPVALLRNDLKQFTGDAFFALLLVWLLVRLEQHWSRQRLGVLVAASIVASFVSTASLFVTAALFASLVFTSLVGRDRTRIIESVVATAVAGLGTLAIAVVFILPNASDSLSGYWADWFLSLGDGLFELGRVAWRRLADLSSLMGFAWPVALVVLTVVGIASVALRGRPAAAITIPVLWLEMLALGVLDRYPFLDRRTSHFLLVLTIVVVAIGVADIAIRLAALRRGLGVVFLVGVAAVYFAGVSEYVGRPTIPNEDVRSQVRYVESNLIAGDTVVVSVGGTFGFPYYWNLDDPVFFDSTGWPTGFGVEYENERIIIATSRSSATIDDALGRATAQAMEAGSTGRIWLVRTHINGAEADAWTRVFDERGLVLEHIDTGIEPVSLIEDAGERR